MTRKRTGERRQLRPVEGYVWCDKLGEVHADTLDPYDYGAPTQSGFEDPRCTADMHTPIYTRRVETP